MEEKEGYKVSCGALYNFYVEMCMKKQINNAMAEYDFVKVSLGTLSVTSDFYMLI